MDNVLNDANKEDKTNLWRRICQVVLALVFGLLLLVSSGMRHNNHALDQKVGLILYIITIAALYFVFFRWDKTAISPPSADRRKSLGAAYIFFGCIQIAGAIVMLPLMGAEAWTLLLSTELIAAGSIMLATGFSLYKHLPWANAAAHIAAFLISLNFPMGLLLSLVTWQQTPIGKRSA